MQRPVKSWGTRYGTEMLYYLLYHTLQHYFSPLNVFRYITVRTVYASLTAMFLALVFGPWLIRHLRELQIGQFIREEGPQEHKKKAGTPTMGGVLIVLSTAVPVLLWADLTNPFILLSLFALFGFAVIGFIDDYAKVSKQRNLGLTAKKKIYFQVFVSLIVGVVLLVLATYSAYSTQFVFPFLKRFRPDLVIHSLLDRSHFSGHSWPLGGTLGTIAVIIKQEILLFFVGGVFVVEALSVILQVGSFKLRGKRIFRMAPIHHHFELLGWSESKVIVRFWIAALVFALFALTTLKLR